MVQVAFNKKEALFTSKLDLNTGLFEKIVRVLTTCHTQYT